MPVKFILISSNNFRCIRISQFLIYLFFLIVFLLLGAISASQDSVYYGKGMLAKKQRVPTKRNLCIKLQ